MNQLVAFEIGDLHRMQNIVVRDVDVFVKMAAHWNRSIERSGMELHFDFDKTQFTMWLMNRKKMSGLPEWVTEDFWIMVNIQCDAFVFWHSSQGEEDIDTDDDKEVVF